MFPIPQENQDAAELLALGDMLQQYGGQRVALDVIRAKGGKRDFMEKVLANASKRPMSDAADALLGFSSTAQDMAGYSIARAIRAQYEASCGDKHAWDRAGLERDLSNLATSRGDRVPDGFYAPIGIMARDFNTATATEAGNLVGGAIDGARTVDPLRKISATGSLGATFLTGLRETLTLPRFVSTTPGWKSEVASATQIAETSAVVALTPKRVAVQMLVSRQALIQATPALDATINRHLIAAIMQQVDDGALNGDGSSDSPVGVRSTSGIGTVTGGTNGAQLTFAHLSDLEGLPSIANVAETDLAGYAVNQSTRRWLRTAQRGTGLPYIWDGGARPLLGHLGAVSNTLSSTLSKGTSSGVCSSLVYSSDWSQLIVGIYGGGVDVLVDRITAADIGKIKITASVYVGCGVNTPAAFAKMDDALTA